MRSGRLQHRFPLARLDLAVGPGDSGKRHELQCQDRPRFETELNQMVDQRIVVDAHDFAHRGSTLLLLGLVTHLLQKPSIFLGKECVLEPLAGIVQNVSFHVRLLVVNACSIREFMSPLKLLIANARHTRNT